MAEGGITSSADRMVGADHAEVRYFTRYVQAESIFCVFIANIFHYSYDHHGIWNRIYDH